MQSLKIEPTQSSFEIDFNTDLKEFVISGESRPENAPAFFEPVILWLEEFKENLKKKEGNEKMKIIFKLDYFNSTSTKYIVDIVHILKEIEDNSKVDLVTEWHYREMDEDIEESGKELIEWTGLNLKLIPYH